mmetsp:Transcript_5438/g.4123  ORF Transcript_5438/g.4123 Transcript_5438/m.4123 type:complete len:172 (+) Transcript_5438:525-1040(+)
MLFEHLVEEYSIDIDKERVNFVSNLIKGDFEKDYSERRWMFEIIANKKNSLDVDKFDYLQRDSKSMGFPGTGFDVQRILDNSRVIDNQICYHSKIYNVLQNVFHTRYTLFREAYQHKVAQAIDFMVVDALVEANPHFKFMENLENPVEYMKYTDSILSYIEYSDKSVFSKS